MLSRRTFLTSTGALTLGAPAILKSAPAPLTTLGLIADAQYADVEAENTRFYRASIEKLGSAVEHFNRQELAACLHLGDLIDRDWRSYDAILKPLAASRHHFHHLLGNHDFDVAVEYKNRVPERLGLARRYSHFDLPGFRLVMLDSNDLSTYARLPGTSEHAAATAALQQAKDAKLPHAQPWNGGFGPAQLQWFDRICSEAAAQQLKVIAFSHHPVFPANALNLWNSETVLALVSRHRHLVAWFNGHNHTGNFGLHDGVPFVNLKGMVETADTSAFSTLALHAERLILTGQGREISRELTFRKA
jgi:hypothetical protein